MNRPHRDQDDDFLLGLPAIGRYVGRQGATVRRWIAEESFPAGRWPCGRWGASKLSIRGWLAERGRMQVEAENAARKARADEAGPD